MQKKPKTNWKLFSFASHFIQIRLKVERFRHFCLVFVAAMSLSTMGTVMCRASFHRKLSFFDMLLNVFFYLRTLCKIQSSKAIKKTVKSVWCVWKSRIAQFQRWISFEANQFVLSGVAVKMDILAITLLLIQLGILSQLNSFQGIFCGLWTHTHTLAQYRCLKSLHLFACVSRVHSIALTLLIRKCWALSLRVSQFVWICTVCQTPQKRSASKWFNYLPLQFDGATEMNSFWKQLCNCINIGQVLRTLPFD